MKFCWQTLSDNQHQKIHDFYLNGNIFIPNTDCRSGRHDIRIWKLHYM